MNQEKLLFENLNFYANEYKEFKSKDVTYKDATYRIFNYGIAVEEWQWQMPGALEARGCMFRIDDDSYSIVSRPMEKFFNFNENGFTRNIPLANASYVSIKEDGTMLSTFIDSDGELALKTKMTLDSFHVKEATKILKQNHSLYQEIYNLTLDDITVIMEWCSPINRIVLSYEEDDLKVIAVRENQTGLYHNLSDIWQHYPNIKQYWVKTFANPFNNNDEVIDDLSEKTEMEGYVFTMPDFQKVKIKTEWYHLHHEVLTNLIHPKKIFELFLEEGLDDIKPIVAADQDRLNYVLSMEKTLKNVYNGLEDEIETVYENNKHLSQKDFAITVLNNYDKIVASAALAKYNNKPFSIKDIMLKNIRRWIGSDGNWIGSD